MSRKMKMTRVVGKFHKWGSLESLVGDLYEPAAISPNRLVSTCLGDGWPLELLMLAHSAEHPEAHRRSLDRERVLSMQPVRCQVQWLASYLEYVLPRAHSLRTRLDHFRQLFEAKKVRFAPGEPALSSFRFQVNFRRGNTVFTKTGHRKCAQDLAVEVEQLDDCVQMGTDEWYTFCRSRAMCDFDRAPI